MALPKNDTGLFNVNILGSRLGSIYIMDNLNITLEVVHVMMVVSKASPNGFGICRHATFD